MLAARLIRIPTSANVKLLYKKTLSNDLRPSAFLGKCERYASQSKASSLRQTRRPTLREAAAAPAGQTGMNFLCVFSIAGLSLQ